MSDSLQCRMGPFGARIDGLLTLGLPPPVHPDEAEGNHQGHAQEEDAGTDELLGVELRIRGGSVTWRRGGSSRRAPPSSPGGCTPRRA